MTSGELKEIRATEPYESIIAEFQFAKAETSLDANYEIFLHAVFKRKY